MDGPPTFSRFSRRGRAWRTLRRAQQYTKAGDGERAASLYEQVLNGSVADAAAAAGMLLAGLRTSQGQFDAAAAAYERLLAMPRHRHTSVAFTGLAALALRQGRLDQARAVYERLAASTDPDLAVQGQAGLSALAIGTGEETPTAWQTLSTGAAAGDRFAQSYLHLLDQARLLDDQAPSSDQARAAERTVDEDD
jgi:tetratricopeptide (TPR) repeat protein